MKQTIEIQAMDLVRSIRDRHAARLADKSSAEVMAFFNRAAAHAIKRSGRLRTIVKTDRTSHKGFQPETGKTGSR